MRFNLARTIYLIAFAHLFIELCLNFLPVIYPLLITTMGLTYAQIGIIALVAGTGATLSQPLFGYISDRWNPYYLTLLSILWIGLFMGLVGFTFSYPSLLLLVGLGGLGSAAFHPPSATIASTSSTTRRGAAVSVFSVGGNLGSAFSPLLIALIISLVGLRGTVVLIPVALIVSLLLYQQFSRAGISSTRGADTPQKLAQKSAPKGSIMGLILIVAVVMCRSWFQISLVTYLPEWMHGRGWSLAAGGQILAGLLLSVSVGSLLGGVMSDKIGRWQVVALSVALLSPTMWLFVTASGLLQVAVAGAIGILIGASFPVTIVMAQEAWPQGLGLASALVMGLGWLPGGIGAFFTGYLADQSSLDLGLQSLIIPPIIGLICILTYAALYRHPVKNEILSTPAG